MITSYISSHEANELLDFALDRFELHIDEGFGDGVWSEELMPPENITTAFTGFIWSALGSPRSEMRWLAAHCVRKLSENDCKKELDELINWMQKDENGVFGYKKFPFYNLHGRLYLLIALARISSDNPQILHDNYRVFFSYALDKVPHILIQKFASEIAINIEKAFPNTYSIDKVKQLKTICVSQMPLKEIEYNETLNSPWHKKGKFKKSIKFYFGLDFDRYWLDPLGDVFGISEKQVEDLTSDIILNEWKIKSDGSYKPDPRQNIWRSTRYGNETYHHHGSYPDAENYNFYLSYHAMLIVAGKLLKNMPVIHKHQWEEDEWSEWLHRHTLTRKDGRWLSDRRDPIPIILKNWMNQKPVENWRTNISDEDFFDVLFFKKKGKLWLIVKGYWEKADDERRESINISTALVSPETSQSLLNALSTCSNPYDYKLPEFEEESMEFDISPFIFKGWIWRQYNDNRLDQNDPYSGEIDYPPYQIGESFIKALNLSPDLEQREWYLKM